MGLRITTNLLSLGVQRNLANTTRAIARSLQRLSSGQRINTGRDDPAGLAMASGLEAQRRGLIQAIRNMNDGQGQLDTAEGALSEQSNILQRMRELAVQASNGTLSSTDRKSLNAELQSLLAEFNRLSNQTQFNGVNLLDGSFGTTALQVGAQKGQTISYALPSMTQKEVFGTTTTYTANGTFQARMTVGVGAAGSSQPLCVVTADVNADGILDLITTDNRNWSVSISLGNGNGTFKTRTTFPTTGYPLSIITSDLNGDGKVDLIVGNGNDTGIQIHLGNGNGTFLSSFMSDTGTSPLSVFAGDLNGDGKIDLLSADRFDASASVLLGNGNGTFLSRTQISTGNYPSSIVASDLNGDGKLDLISTDNSDATASIMLGNGNGSFKVRSTVATGVSPVSTLAADLNGDGKQDLVTIDSNGAGSYTASLLFGNGNGTFAARTTIATGGQTTSIIAADLNGDGKLDLVTANTTDSTVGIALGNGNGTFKTRSTLNDSFPRSVTAGDLNGDGALDLVTADVVGQSDSVFLGCTDAVVTNAVVDISTQSTAQNTLSVLDTALRYVNSSRANVGAISSRLDFARSVVQTAVENITAARSQIMDTDMAAETAEFARLQILQKAGVAVLGQANTQSQLALKLLENL